MANLCCFGQEGVSRSISDKPPTHYYFKLESFSQLANNKIENYTSNEFQAGGCKWKLVLHPNGNKNKGITDHISLYLVLVQPHSLGPAWEIRAVFRLFLLDQNNDRYLSLEDAAQNGRRFHMMKLAWGFDKFIPLDTFKDAANGYLVDDTCVFGAEVYICQETIAGKGECLSMIKDAVAYKHTWRLDFSSFKEDCANSKPFNAAEHKWKLQLYPKGKGSGVGGYVSLYLTLAAPENLPPTSRIYAEFTIRILDQLNNNHYYGTGKILTISYDCKNYDSARNLYFPAASYWFSASNSTCGWPRFVPDSYFHQPATGLLVKKICQVEAEVKVHGVANTI